MTKGTRRQVMGGALALGGLLLPGRPGPVFAQEGSPVASPAAGWRFTDFLGRETTLPERPTRIAAEIATAAALHDMGVPVHAVWGGPANDPEGQP